MEDFSRRVLSALTVAAAGPGAAMLTLLLVAPTVLAASMPDTDGSAEETFESVLVGFLVGGLVSVVLACFVAAAATLVAMHATGCPRPLVAWGICLALSPPWLAALSMLGVDERGSLVLLGALHGAVRLGFDYLEPSGSRTDQLVS